MKRRSLLLLLPMLLGSMSSYAAQQYVTVAGAYGSVTVAESPGCSANNPFVYATRSGFALTSNSTCTLTFDHPIATSSVTIDIDGNGVGDITTIATNAGPYTIVPGDISAPLVPAGSPGSIAVSGGAINGNGSGTFRFTNSPPATITSLSVTITAGAGGSFYRVGFDGGAASVPTLGEWALIALAGGLLLVAVLRMRIQPAAE